MALGTIPVITGLGTAANAAVTVGESISAFPDRDMVVAVGYDLGQELLVEVLRDDVVIGSTRGPALSTDEGVGLEVNHGVEGTPRPGECWNGYTPDIIGGDVIRVSPAGSAVSDTMTVTDLEFSGGPFVEPDGSVSVKGTATPGTAFAVEFRRDKPDPRFRGEARPPVFEGTTNVWKANYRVVAGTEGLTAEEQRDILVNEASWAAVAGGEGTENTLAELGEPAGVAAGCPGSNDPNTLVRGLDPINIATVADGGPGVTFSGTARAGVAAVGVTVGALGELPATFTPDADASAPWTLTVPSVDLRNLPEGAVAVTPRFDGVAGATRTVVKDTAAPTAPTASIAPGTYSGPQSVTLNKPAGEGTSKVFWEIGNSDVPDPDEFSHLYSSQISVTSTQTIKARLIDAAGNPGTVGTFAYRIGTPPAAPTSLRATESATAAGTANLTWTAAAGATGYNAYRNDAKINATPITGTSFVDSAAGLGEHSYVVRAVEANGIESLDSNRVPVTVAAPDVPTGLRATEGDTRVTLSWTAAPGAAGYRVYRDGAALPSTVAGTSFTNTGLTNGTLYEYAITSLDAGGNESAPTGIVQAVPDVPADTTAPPAPTITPANGTYSSAQTVTMTVGEAGAVIRYTIGDGTSVPTEPTASDAQYTGPIAVSTSQVIRAAAFDAAGNRSATVTRTLTIDTTTGGTRTQTVNASADTMVHQGRATTTHGTATVLNVDSQYTTGNASTRTSAYLRFDIPALEAGETITGAALNLNITNATPNGPSIFRTSTTWTESSMTWNTGQPARLDNTPDGNFGSIATGRRSTPITGITGAGTVSFQVYADDVDGAQFSSRETTSDPQLVLTVSTGGTTNPPPADTTAPPAPSVTPATGTYTAAQSVTMTDSEAGAVIRYTVGTGTSVPADPTDSSPEYTGAISVGSSQVIKAAAFDAAGNRSGITQRNYTITTGGTNAPPTVTTRSPASGATGVAAGSDITATFSETVQGVSTTTFFLRAAGSSTDIAGTVTRNGTTNQWILDPGADLAAGTSYTATLTGGSTAIRDTAATPAALATTSWSFTTAAPATGGDTTVPTITARTPGSNAYNVSPTGTITATFSEAVQGLSSSTVVLKNAAGTTIPAAVTYNATTRVVTLDPTSTLPSDIRYNVTITGGTTAVRDMAGNPLATSTWSFLVGPAPTITARTPAASATGVSRTSTITATFSEPIVGYSTTSVTVRVGTAAPVAATVTYNATTRTVTLDPSTTLAANTTYTVRVQGGGTAIRDVAGNRFVNTSWTFRTGA